MAHVRRGNNDRRSRAREVSACAGIGYSQDAIKGGPVASDGELGKSQFFNHPENVNLEISILFESEDEWSSTNGK
jgi:hypothetical protein